MGLHQRLVEGRLRLGWGFRSDDVHMYGFDNGRSTTEARNYLGYSSYLRDVRPILNDPRSHPLTENKWVFYRLASGSGLPIPYTLGLFDAVFGVTWEGRPLRTTEQLLSTIDGVRPNGLVIKPAGGQRGRNLLILENIDYVSGTARTRRGDDVDLGQTIAELSVEEDMRGYRGYIVQKLLEQHPFFADFGPTTANTVRVITLLSTDGEALIPFATTRLGRVGCMVDSWAQGGVSVAIDVATGTLGPGIMKAKLGEGWVEVHPDTQKRFRGCQVPFWPDVLSTVRRAARVAPGIQSIGWDVLITPDGPVLLEANGDWDLQGAQIHTEGWLALPGIRDEFHRHGVELPDGRMARSALHAAKHRGSRLVQKKGRQIQTAVGSRT